MDLSIKKTDEITSGSEELASISQNNDNGSSSSLSNKRRLEEEEESSSKRARIEGIGSVVASHYNNIDEKGLVHRNKSKIFYMRNFNNWVKSVVIDEFVNKTRKNNYGDFVVMDLGCGKGGDIFKWKKNFVHHVIFVDIAESSMKQCNERYNICKGRNNKLFSAEFIVADFTKTRLNQFLKNGEQKVDLISCQFALHYAFESLPQAEQLIRNVSENLRSGGHFIATVPNAYKIMAKSQKKADGSEANGCPSARNDFGNDVFKISFNEDKTESNRPLFGDKYHFSLEGVVDCPEFFVHLATLVRICQKYDLDCRYVEDFENIFENYKKEKQYSQLLNNMNCLEQYPQPYKHQDRREYESADRYLSRKRERSVMTLSASEWEATCLYLAVAFRKK